MHILFLTTSFLFGLTVPMHLGLAFKKKIKRPYIIVFLSILLDNYSRIQSLKNLFTLLFYFIFLVNILSQHFACSNSKFHSCFLNLLVVLNCTVELSGIQICLSKVFTGRSWAVIAVSSRVHLEATLAAFLGHEYFCIVLVIVLGFFLLLIGHVLTAFCSCQELGSSSFPQHCLRFCGSAIMVEYY